MSTPKERRESRLRRHRRVRVKIHGTGERPRLAVFRSLKHIYAQIIDDDTHRVLLTVSSLSPEVREQSVKGKVGVGTLVGKTLAERAVGKGIERVAFDRGGYLFHGRVKAVAEGAREGGLKF